MIRCEKSRGIILASHQPDFFPWMGYFYKIFQSDFFVFSDNVQYSKTGRHNYNLILTQNGPQRLTMPIHYHAINLNELKLAVDEKVISKMLKTLQQAYKKAAHFDEAYPVIEKLLLGSLEQESLASFNYDCIMEFCKRFGLIESENGLKARWFFLSSELDLKKRRDERIIEMCKLLNAKAYISGSGAKDYHIEEDYRENGISLIYSDYEPIIYPQVGKQSATNMCSIDYVMNCGFEIPRGWKRSAESDIWNIHSELQEGEDLQRTYFS